MGLLDFISKGGNNAQDPNTNPPAVPDFASIQQSYTNQSLANVSYPMANPTPYTPTNPVPPQYNPTEQQRQEFPDVNAAPAPEFAPNAAVAPQPLDIMEQGNVPMQGNVTMPEIPPMTQKLVQNQNIQPENTTDVPADGYVDPSKHPVIPAVVPNQGHTATLPEGIKITTFEPVNPESESAAVPQPVANEPVVDQPQSVEVPEVKPFEVQPSPEFAVSNFDSNTSLNVGIEAAPTTNQFESTTVAPMQNNSVELPVMPDVNTLTPVNTEAISALPSQVLTPEVPVNQNEIANQSQSIESQAQQSNLPTEPAVEQSAPVEGIEIGVGSMDSPMADLTSAQNSNLDPMPAVESTLPVASTNEISTLDPNNALVEDVTQNAVIPVPEVTEVKESKAETAPEATQPVPVNFEMNYFRTIGFIGLNTQPNLKVVEKVSELAGKLSDYAEVFIIDSAKGYAKTIFDSAKEKNIELTGMYLKPFHSTYSDEAELGDYENFTVMMFSNNSDKIKNLIKESDILVMPEITGLNSLGTLFEIWSTNSMYPGQHKQLILLGKGWTNILTQLKTLFKLTDADLSFVNVCATAEEALAKITELDKMYLNKEVKQPRKVIDLREEDDEEGLFI